MELEHATIAASLAPRPGADLGGRTAREVMAALLRRGYRTLLLTGRLLDEPGAGLNVEDDARLLLEWYAYAEARVAAGGPFEFDTVLADGAFVISSNSDGERVRLLFQYVPELDSTQASIAAAEVSVHEYAWWWRSIAAALLALTSEQGAGRGR